MKKQKVLRVKTALFTFMPFMVMCVTIILTGIKAYAVPFSYETDNYMKIAATGTYINWDGVTNVAQFSGADGNICFAVDSGDSVTVYKTNSSLQVSGKVTLKKQHSTFGTVICDKNWNYYVVTGEENQTDDTAINTIFISKYDSSGKHIATVGDNGSSSLAWYYDDSFYTKKPFRAGNCDAAIYGNVLTVNYARRMYNEHLSNSVFSVNITNMSKVDISPIYESHSFAQRVVAADGGFVYASEGDAYDRCFKIYGAKMSGNTLLSIKENDVFDFWIKEGASDDMSIVNNNYAHMGGLAALSNGKVAFVGQSAKSLNSSAANESEEIFIQIFDPYKDLNSADSFVTTGVRSGKSGLNGTTDVTNYGVKWLTSYGNDYNINNVQIAHTTENEIVVLYELWEGGSGYYQQGEYKGIFYIVLNESGKITKDATLFSKTAKLNPCEMPVASGGKVFWVGNMQGNSKDRIYLYSLNPKLNRASVSKEVTGKDDLVYNGSAQALVNGGEVTGGKFAYALGEDENTPPDAGSYSEQISKGTGAGYYYVWSKVIGDASHTDLEENCEKVVIDWAPATVTKAPESRELIYNGMQQELVTPGVAEGGTFCYAEAYWQPYDELFSETIPTASDPGTYTVWYKVKGDENHIDSEKNSLTVNITKAMATVTNAPEAKKLTYNGTRQELVSEGSSEGGIMQYAISGSPSQKPGYYQYSTTIPSALNVGEYYVWYKAEGDEYHIDSEPQYVKVSIQDPLVGFVTRMYKVVLNREPDEEGLNNWVNQLKSGEKAGADIAQGFYLSPEMMNKGLSNEEFVELAYEGMMGRGSDPGGMSDWTEALRCGVSYNGIVQGFVGSREFSDICNEYDITPGTVTITENRDQNVGVTKFVSRLYTEVLGRDFDEAGLNDWTGRINANSSKENILSVSTNGFLNSQEFLRRGLSNEDFVRVMYGTYLGREPEEAGFNDWVSQLYEGRSRDEIAAGFANSQEFANIMARYGL